MTEKQMINQISRCLARLRNQANLSQASLAKKIGVDQAKLSRIENGEIYSPVDVEKYLDALEASDAQKFKTFLNSSWDFIDVPNFWNPQLDSLMYAEEVIGKITNFLESSHSKSPLGVYLTTGKEQLISLAKYLHSQDHNIAFIGYIGVGKSTAISHLFNLLISKEKQDNDPAKPILETGGGGTTICEVQIIDSDEYGISLIPYSYDDFNGIISDFCKIFWEKYTGNNNIEISQSTEIVRAIRNMTKLTMQSIGSGKNRMRVDPIEQLVQNSSSEDEFKIKILNMINLQARKKNSIIFDKDPSKNPTAWVAENFIEINNGRRDDMPMPKRITLMIPNFNLRFNANSYDYNISVIDTKGIDDIMERSDLDDQIRNERSIIIFCVGFNEASGTPTKAMISHIQNDIGISVENGKFALLVLPHSGESLQVKDDLGNVASDSSEGYEIKNDQIRGAIHEDIPIYFYNAFEDTPKSIVSQVREQIDTLRKHYAAKMDDLSLNMAYAMQNSEEIAYHEALKFITKRISFFIKGNKNLPKRKKNIYDDVYRIFSNAHASTLWASTRRRGAYTNLNICYAISNSSNSDAIQRFNEWFMLFNGEINSIKADESLLIADKYINDIESFTSGLKNKFLESVCNCATEVFCEKITSSMIWNACAAEWGRGPGFKIRVLNHIKSWFDANTSLQDELDKLIEKFWNELVMSKISQMISSHIIEH